MKTNTLRKIILSFAATALLVATSVTGATLINLDIQGLAGDTDTIDYTGSNANGPIASASTTWNHFTAGVNPLTAPNNTLTDLVDSTGAATDVDVAFGSGWAGTYANNSEGVDNYLFGDRAYTTAGGVGTFTISGLVDGGSYNLALIGSSSAGFITDFTIAGAGTLTATGGSAGTTSNGPLSFNEGVTHVLFENIVATGGAITFSTKQHIDTGSGLGSSVFGVFSGLQIQAVPEPSSAALLLGLGSITLILRRRR